MSSSTDLTRGLSLFDRQRLIRDHSQHSGSDLLVLLVLFTFADAEGVAFPSTQTLARAARTSERTVERALNNLRASGEVSSLGKRGPNGALQRRIEFAVLAARPDLAVASPNPPPMAGCTSPPQPTNPPPVAGCDAPSTTTNPPPVSVPTRHFAHSNPPSVTLPNKEKGPLERDKERASRGSARARTARAGARAPLTSGKIPTKVQKPEDVERQTWDDWVALRKAKRAPITATVLKGARAEAEKAGMTLEAFLAEWVLRGSQGLKAEWLSARKPSAASQLAASIEGVSLEELYPDPAPPAFTPEQEARFAAVRGDRFMLTGAEQADYQRWRELQARRDAERSP